MASDTGGVRAVLSLYENGKKIRMMPAEATQPSLAESGATMMLGQGCPARYFNGEVAEFLLFRRALTNEEYAKVHRYLEGRYGIGKDRLPHTGFGLSSGGETLPLTPAGASKAADTVEFEGGAMQRRGECRGGEIVRSDGKRGRNLVRWRGGVGGYPAREVPCVRA